MRDALVTALSLDTFNRHADKVGMAACAQLINCLNALFFAHEDKFIVTPNFHVFDMYSAHQGAMAVCCKFSAPDVHYMRDGKAASFWGLKGSASLKGKLLTLTVVNADAANTQEAELSVPGSTFSTVSAKVLSSPDMHAHNTFLEPDAVLPSTQTVRVKDDRAVFQFPAASVTVLTFSLG
jgi:alpha-N-arabinofuranosidase